MNLPHMVYADLMGLPRPLAGRARPGVRWCSIRDMAAARTAGMPLTRWLVFALSCEAKSGLALDDPMPLVRAALSRYLPQRAVAGPHAALEALVG